MGESAHFNGKVDNSVSMCALLNEYNLYSLKETCMEKVNILLTFMLTVLTMIPSGAACYLLS